MRRLLRDESGQATTEYILMIVMALVLVLSVIKKFIQPTLDRLKTQITTQLENTLFGGGDFHRLRIGR